MLVDKILEYYGDSPAVYVNVQDKIIALLSHIFVSGFIYFPIVFGLLPLLYFVINRKKYKKNKSQFLKKAALYSVGGIVAGFLLLYIILALSAGLAARSLYGG